MDDYLDHLLSSQWVDTNSTVRSSWIGSLADQVNGFLADPAAAYQGDENPPSGLVSSSHMMKSSCSEGVNRVPSDCRSARLVSDNPSLTDGKGLVSSHQSQNKQLSHDKFLLMQRGIEDGTSSESLGIQLNMASQIAGCQRSSDLPIVGDSAKLAAGIPDRGLALSNERNLSGYEKLGDSFSMLSPSWSTSYTDISILPSILGEAKLDEFNLQGDFAETDEALLGKRCLGDNMPLISEQGNLQSSSLAAGPQVPLPQNVTLQPLQKLPQCGEVNSTHLYGSVSQLQPAAATNGGCTGSVRPRVRARRGQATDPHSIAERLRREKISERMKNLQELVPSSNKTDKASMLDEIIEYVKFLQLQVKVLSMSRLGATGAVVPLITDAQSQGSHSLQLSASLAHAADLTESQESIAFEQEVVKLMESNVTSAMQYLQTKCLCLMPIALATAISGGKTSPNGLPKAESSSGCMPAANFPYKSQRFQASSCGSESLVIDIRPKCERDDSSTNSFSCVADVSRDDDSKPKV